MFIFSEKVTLLRDKSKMNFNETNKELKFCFKMSWFISSKPWPLPNFKEKNAVFISLSDKVTSLKELSDPLRYISNDLYDCGTTLTKYLLKLLTMVFWLKIFLLMKMRCFGSELLSDLPLLITFSISCHFFLFSFFFFVFVIKYHLSVMLRLCFFFNRVK